jgi:hypothetical protein
VASPQPYQRLIHYTLAGHGPNLNDLAERDAPARDLAALADGEVVDLLVVGLGATGAGVALDAASRGYG